MKITVKPLKDVSGRNNGEFTIEFYDANNNRVKKHGWRRSYSPDASILVYDTQYTYNEHNQLIQEDSAILVKPISRWCTKYVYKNTTDKKAYRKIDQEGKVYTLQADGHYEMQDDDYKNALACMKDPSLIKNVIEKALKL